MKDDHSAPDIFNYHDYRLFLSDYYRFEKSRSRSFSYRVFSRRVGISSPNLLKLVIDGQRNLTPDMAVLFAKACKLKGDEIDYFQDLVAFCRAKTQDARSASYRRLSGFRRYRQIHRLDVVHARYVQNWYLPAIRELVTRKDFEENPRWIARALLPSITLQQATEGLKTLLELGLLVRDEAGALKQSEPALSTGDEIRSLHVAHYHHTMMEMAKQSIDRIPTEHRDISSLTLGLSESGLHKLKKRLQRFRKEILEFALLEPETERVVQLNLQLFPLSQPKEDS